MENKLSTVIKLIHKLPESRLDELSETISKMIEEEKKAEAKPDCPDCFSEETVKYGTQCGTQRYRCNDCGKVFSARHNSVMWHAHAGEAVWKQVIRDTIEGKSIDNTAKELSLTHDRTYNMRHKILMAIEEMEKQNPTVLSGICELDETFVLESYKGQKLPEDFWREPRTHGAKAQKCGISDEQVAICTGVDRNGKVFARTVNRATPSSEEIADVFGKRIEEGSLVLTDGARSYNTLEDLCRCDVSNVQTEDAKERHFLHINTVNSLHSFIKKRYISYSGVATKHLNRYNALFALAFRATEDTVNEVYNALCSNNKQNSYFTVHDTKTEGLLTI